MIGRWVFILDFVSMMGIVVNLVIFIFTSKSLWTSIYYMFPRDDVR